MAQTWYKCTQTLHVQLGATSCVARARQRATRGAHTRDTDTNTETGTLTHSALLALNGPDTLRAGLDTHTLARSLNHSLTEPSTKNSIYRISTKVYGIFSFLLKYMAVNVTQHAGFGFSRV
jgi:hypothetical protein